MTESPPPALSALFHGFFTIGVSGFGGVMPWARREFVERRHWLTEDEFIDALAMCQFIPGPNIVNFSVALGSRFHGVMGAATCVTALLAAPMALVIAAGLVLERVADNHYVTGALHGMACVAVALVAVMTLRIATPLLRRRDWIGLGVSAVALIVVALLRLPLVPSLLTMAPASVAVAWWRRRRH